jgi:hypothetical protein
MGASTEGDVTILLSPDIKRIWFRKIGGIAVCSIEHLEHHLSLPNLFTTQLSILLS